MGRARLTRIDAVGEMAAVVDAFRHEANAVLEGLEMEIRRALEWIHHDRHEHWNHQVHRGWDRITEARIQLQNAMATRRIGDHAPACVDEKKALARAKQRLEIAQHKVEAVRRFAREIDRAVDEYRGARVPLAGWLEADVPKALAALRRMMANLEDYLAVPAPDGGPAVATPLTGADDEPGRMPVPPPADWTASSDRTALSGSGGGPTSGEPPASAAPADGAAVDADATSAANPAGGAPCDSGT